MKLNMPIKNLKIITNKEFNPMFLRNNLNTSIYPKVIFSFSSKNLYDIKTTFNNYISHLDTCSILLSLYDLKYIYDMNSIVNILKKFNGEIFLDSGTFEYENNFNQNDIYYYDYKRKTWNYNKFISTLNKLKLNDSKYFIVNFDDRNTLDIQISKSIQFFNQFDKNIHKVLLVHPYNQYWDKTIIFDLISYINKTIESFYILGVTEKEIGARLIDKIININLLRKNLDNISNKYIPIHIFGCGDPKNIILLFFAGADIFDGLSWLRFYFKEKSSHYNIEFEYDKIQYKKLNSDLILHNIQYLSNLVNELNYTINSQNFDKFNQEFNFVKNVLE